MKQARWTFNRARKVYEPAELEENVVREITERLWLQAKIKVWLVRERIPQKWKRWQQLSTPGIPDLIGWIPREMLPIDVIFRTPQIFNLAIPLFIEVKRPGKNVHRPAQERFIAEAKANGCVAFFAESWDDVVDELGKFEIELKGD